MKKYAFGIVFSLFLTAFTAYALLDTFVIPRSYADVDSAPVISTVNEIGTGEIEAREEITETKETEQAEKTEQIDNTAEVQISISEYRVSDTTVYVADIVVPDASYLKTAFAYGTYGKNVKETTSAIASENSAILAINGDFYGSRNSGYVIRNGVLYRASGNGGEDLVIYADGSFEIINEDNVTAQELIDKGAVQVLSFGPALVENGEISVTSRDEVGMAKMSNPRTAIGIIDENHYVFIVSDGRTSESAGLTLLELAEFAKSLGAETVYNLDGGGSSTMVYNGEIINNPTTNGRIISEREVSDIVYIG